MDVDMEVEKTAIAETICDVVADIFGISHDHVFGRLQSRSSVSAMHAKHVAMYFVREHTKWPYRTIDNYFGVGEGGAQYAYAKVKHHRGDDRYAEGMAKVKSTLKEALAPF